MDAYIIFVTWKKKRMQLVPVEFGGRNFTVVSTAGMGLLTATENGWEIDWSLFEFPNHLHR